MTANDGKSYFAYLNKLVDQYSNTYNSSNADYSPLTEKLETNPMTPKCKTELLSIGICKGYTENWAS